MEDVELFLGWLKDQGLGDKQLAAYRNYLAELHKHPSLSAALKAAEEAGMPAREIANMRAVAGRFAEYQATGTAGLPAPPARAAPTAASLEVEKASRPAPLRDHSVEMPRKGCICTRRQDVYLDNDFGALAKLLGGGAGLGMIFLSRMIGIVGALGVALGLAGLGGLATVISICLRCQNCRRRVTDLDSDERIVVHKGRGLVVLVTAGLLAGAGLCGFVWWHAVKARAHQTVDVNFQQP